MSVTEVQSRISEAEFEKFREFFYRKTGIRFENTKRYFVDKRLLDRMRANGFDTFKQYFTFMRFQASGVEVQELINVMTVNETYFFREDYQFECLVDNVMNEIASRKKPGELIRIWSIPSASGEEPYSIAMFLLEQWPGIDQYEVEIVSSDIDSNMLKRCHEGIYSERSVKGIPTRLLRKYFTALPGNRFAICDDLKASVKFTQVNLAQPSQTRAYRGFDVVFCRNLLIYFDDASRREAADVFYDALNPNGFVFLGHSESMSRISSLYKVRKFPKAMVYQKPSVRSQG
jgi:chemotaxis protein methyltransferase CheR